MRAITLTLLAMTAAMPAALAQGPVDPSPITTEQYLGIVAGISPEARTAAELYLGAHLLRCRRTMSTATLRRAFLEREPVLMAVLRHTGQNNTRAAMDEALRVRCQ